MPTKISYQTWSGGTGCGDHAYALGYCLEEPEDVLSAVLFSHIVYRYKGVYRPIDDRCPNNVEGLIIESATETKLNKRNPGCEIHIKAKLSELNLGAAKTDIVRTKESILNAYREAEKWHIQSWMTNQKHIKEIGDQLDEVKEVLDKRLV